MSHLYSCTCLDACTNSTVCKHIHFVQMKNAEPESNRNTSAVMSQKMDCDLEYFQRVSLFDFPVENATSTRDALLTQINARLTSITSVCNNIDDVTCLKTVYGALGDVLGTCITSKPKQKKKNIYEIQRQFHSTWKKRKLSTKLLGKPSIDEVKSCELDFNSTETGICAICFCEDNELDHEPVNWIAL